MEVPLPLAASRLLMSFLIFQISIYFRGKKIYQLAYLNLGGNKQHGTRISSIADSVCASAGHTGEAPLKPRWRAKKTLRGITTLPAPGGR